jgi:hypothetical protein
VTVGSGAMSDELTTPVVDPFIVRRTDVPEDAKAYAGALTAADAVVLMAAFVSLGAKSCEVVDSSTGTVVARVLGGP